jgi:hypothetical protein
MTRNRILFALVLIVMATASLKAQEPPANELVKNCKVFAETPLGRSLTLQQTLNSALCAGYMRAIVDFNPAIRWYCPPRD